jgi:NarL family two-component system response regulator LiaR
MSQAERPVRVAVVNDYELVVVGVAALLAPYPQRVHVVEVDSSLPVLLDVDVILYDTFGQVQGEGIDVESMIRGGEAKVVVYSWNLHQELVQASLDKGAAGYLSKALQAEELVTALERIHAGAVIVPTARGGVAPAEGGVWPGRDRGLSVREAEIIALVTQGLSNQEIADRCYLSINSVKTYIRTAYRKMGVARRSQAVLWGIKNGFEPDVVRRVDDAEPQRS